MNENQYYSHSVNYQVMTNYDITHIPLSSWGSCQYYSSVDLTVIFQIGLSQFETLIY